MTNPADAEREREWRSIATAPRDGGPFICATATGWVGEAYFEAERDAIYAAGTHWMDAHDGQIYDAIYWMPLPPPPSPKGSP